MVKIKILPVSDNWVIIKWGVVTYALNKKGYYIALEREVWVFPFLKDAVKKLAKTAKQYGLIDYDVKIYVIPYQQLSYKGLQVAAQLFYHYGDERGRELFNKIMQMVKTKQ